METGKKGKLQSDRRGEQEYDPRVSRLLGGGDVDHGQRWDVEFEVGFRRKGVSGAAALLQCSVSGEIA